MSTVDIPGWEGWIFRVTFQTPYGPGELTVSAPADVTLTPGLLRRVPFGKILRRATNPWPQVGLAVAGVPVRSRRPYGGGSDEHSRAVVAVYRAAVSQGAPPREAVQRHFDVKAKTADRWIADARRRGLLGTWPQERTAT